jgi:hypothetical protein
VQAILQQALAVRDRHRTGVISAHGLAVARGHLITRLAARLDRPSHVPDVQRFAAHLPREFAAIWSFLFDPTIDATNWRAEQAIRPAVAWGSLCILSFKARKHCGSRVAVNLPRPSIRMTTSDRRSYRIALKIRAANLPGRIRDDLLGGQHAAVDERADKMMTDAGVFRGVAHRHPLLAIHGRGIGADARGTARLFDAVRGPRLSLSRADAHAIQGSGHLRVRPGARHLSNDRLGLVGGPLAMFSGFRFSRAYL